MPSDKQPLLEELSSIVGSENITADWEQVGSYSKDFTPFPPVWIGTVVNPASVDEVSRILKVANSHKTPLTVMGGGISLTGRPQVKQNQGIVLSTRRLNRVLDIDESNMTATAEGGVIMKDLEDQVAKRGYFVHTVALPVRFVTIGGVLSGVIGGGLPPNLPSSGPGANFLLGLKVVLPDGTLLNTNAGGSNTYQERDFIKGGNGPDVMGLFVGDGGLYGVKVEATVQLFQEPILHDADCRIFDDYGKLWKAFRRLIRLNPLPYTQFRVRDKAFWFLDYLVEGFSRNEIDSSLDLIARTCEEEGGTKASESERETARRLSDMGELRSDKNVRAPRMLVAFVSGYRDFPFVYLELKNYVVKQVASNRLDEIGVRVTMYFRPCLRNSVYCVLNIDYDPNSQESRSEVLKLGKVCYEKIVDLGCCPEPHQGYGAEVMSRAWSNEFREFVIGTKKMLDPNMILNCSAWGIQGNF